MTPTTTIVIVGLGAALVYLAVAVVGLLRRVKDVEKRNFDLASRLYDKDEKIKALSVRRKGSPR